MNDDVLSKAFARFPSFNMARVRSSQTYLGLFLWGLHNLIGLSVLHILNGKYEHLHDLFRCQFEVHEAIN